MPALKTQKFYAVHFPKQRGKLIKLVIPGEANLSSRAKRGICFWLNMDSELSESVVALAIADP